MTKRLFALLIALLLASGALATHAQDDYTIIDALQRDPNARFTSLLTALDTAGLTPLLRSGEFTLLAPTNGAFRTLADSEGMLVRELLADAELLSVILPYHVLNGRVAFTDIEEIAGKRNDGLATIRALDGGRIRMEVDANADTALINFGQSSFVELDLQADNGIIHVVNNVLIPIAGDGSVTELVLPEVEEGGEVVGTTEVIIGAGDGDADTDELLFEIDADAEEPVGNIMDVLETSDDFTVLKAALTASNLDILLIDPDPDREWTLFAPTDEAFGKALVSMNLTEDDLLAHPLLDEILLYHLFDETLTTEEMSGRSGDYNATELEGGAILFIVAGEGDDAIITLNGFVDVLQTDVLADNGVIHAIDNVLLPIEALEEFGLQ